jgi:hypothetical protein
MDRAGREKLRPINEKLISRGAGVGNPGHAERTRLASARAAGQR